MTAYCPDCLIVEVPPNARDGRCDWCRPVRRHSKPRQTTARSRSDEAFRRLLDHHNPTH